MTAAEAIQVLQRLTPEEHIILAFWQHDQFPEVPADHWPDAAANAEDETDWSRTHDTLADQLAIFLASPAACPDCNATQTGPVPPYCRKHDGDYMSFLALHNCD